jgi:hypothetical protein
VNANLRDVAIRDIGCICCLKRGIASECEKHHLLTTGLHGNGKRRGEQFTVGLCTYHHRGGHGVGGAVARSMEPTYGPNYADNAGEFRVVFGDDSDLLAEQQRLIDIWRGSIMGVGE